MFHVKTDKRAQSGRNLTDLTDSKGDTLFCSLFSLFKSNLLGQLEEITSRLPLNGTIVKLKVLHPWSKVLKLIFRTIYNPLSNNRIAWKLFVAFVNENSKVITALVKKKEKERRILKYNTKFARATLFARIFVRNWKPIRDTPRTNLCSATSSV